MSVDSNKDRVRRKNKIALITTITLVSVMIVIILVLYYNMNQLSEPIHLFSELVEQVDADNVDYLEISGSTVTVMLKDGESFSLFFPITTYRDTWLIENNVPIRIGKSGANWLGYVPSFLSVGMLALLIMVVCKQMGITLVRKKPNVISEVRFSDVAGLSKVKEEIQIAVSLLKNPELTLGYKVRGIMLYGPPGCGKTLLAKAVAGEAGVPFFSFSAGDFASMFVGKASNILKGIEKDAKRAAPCVVFIDEIDSIASSRGNDTGNGVMLNQNLTVNTLLAMMDGVTTCDGILFIGATNILDTVDSALLRPGRFDKQIYVNPPVTKTDVKEITDLYLRGKDLDKGTNIEDIYSLFYGLTGAQVKFILNEAAMESMKKYADTLIRFDCVQTALMKSVMQGVVAEHSTKEDLDIAAIHEAGHAVVGMLSGREIVSVSTIGYNSGVGGVTLFKPDTSMVMTQEVAKSKLMYLYGGMLAEEVILGERSTGCSSDLKQVKGLLTQLKECDMITSKKSYKEMIIMETSALVNKHRDDIIVVANALKERQTLLAEDMLHYMNKSSQVSECAQI